MTTTKSNTPNPSIMQRFAPQALPQRPVTVSAQPVKPGDPGRIVRPGTVEVLSDTETHDGVVKAKTLVLGQRVRPWLHGEPKGGERIVGKIRSLKAEEAAELLNAAGTLKEPIEAKALKNGDYVQITWASAHVPEIRKAAYRFFDKDLVGTPLVVKQAALVAYEQV